jgi:hypothetical protein
VEGQKDSLGDDPAVLGRFSLTGIGFDRHSPPLCSLFVGLVHRSSLVAWFTEGFDTPDFKAAKVLLEARDA